MSERLRVGVDLIEIERIRRALERHGESFKRRCFPDEEIAYCDSKPNPAQHYAGRFAAKEAVGKAIGSGVYFTWNEIEVRGRPKPGVHLSGRTAAWAKAEGIDFRPFRFHDLRHWHAVHWAKVGPFALRPTATARSFLDEGHGGLSSLRLSHVRGIGGGLSKLRLRFWERPCWRLWDGPPAVICASLPEAWVFCGSRCLRRNKSAI